MKGGADSNSVRHLSDEDAALFHADGFLAVHGLAEGPELERLRSIVDRLLSGAIDSGRQRNDLGGFRARVHDEVENVIQIMLPSDFAPELLTSDYFRRASAVARGLLGDDMERDFDMIIAKAPRSLTEVPWHQDAAYWHPDIPDRRAVSCWLALDDATIDNGCMWFVPGSHLKPVRPHAYAGAHGYALIADVAAGEGRAVPLPAGSATFHQGGTLHYSGGNRTEGMRRALIASFRPASMIQWEREHGFDHRVEVER